jgi:leader peptidase (prepilin peptidase)/N-methyltransferase
LIGFAAGFMLFQVPAMLGISIGWGDVKYAGAAGFYLGLAGLFQAILIMAIGMGLYGIYLKITKKGNLKTRVPMGPYLSLGMMLAILIPIVNEAAKTILPGGF